MCCCAIVRAKMLTQLRRNPRGTVNQACGEGTALVNTTDSAHGKSFRCTRDADDNAVDFISASRTLSENNATASSTASKRGDELISEVAHTGTDGESLIEITNFGVQEFDVADLRVEVTTSSSAGLRDTCGQGGCFVEKLGPGETVVLSRDEGGRGAVRHLR